MFEAAYRIRLRQGGYLSSPDLQYIVNPGGRTSTPTRLVVGSQIGAGEFLNRSARSRRPWLVQVVGEHIACTIPTTRPITKVTKKNEMTAWNSDRRRMSGVVDVTSEVW